MRAAWPYDGEVAFADAQLGALLDALQATSGRDRTLIVVAGDHGESLGEHGEADHGMLLYEAALRVPLVMAGPGVPAATLDRPGALVDIVPTVLARLGLPAPAAGRARHPGRGSRERLGRDVRRDGVPASGRVQPAARARSAGAGSTSGGRRSPSCTT